MSPHRRTPLLLAAVFFLSLLPAGAAGGAMPEDALLAPFEALYGQAVRNAQANLAHAQSPPSAAGLWDLDADNANLLWSGEPGRSLVQVTTFTKASYYQSYTPGQALSAAVDLWVLPAPQMRAEVPAEDPLTTALNPWLATSMYLGLPPANTNNAVVTLWVDPGWMLRPAIDTAIDRHDQDASFFLTLQTVPTVSTTATPRDAPAPGFASASSYVEWFLERQSAIFDFSIKGGPYPWTGLGYTYDWNPAAADVVGGSEFLVPRGSPAVFVSLTPVTQYYR